MESNGQAENLASESDKWTVESDLDAFVEHISGLNFALPVMILLSMGLRKVQEDGHIHFLEAIGALVEEDEFSWTYKIGG